MAKRLYNPDTLRFADPTTGEELINSTVPEALTYFPEFSAGIHFLEQHGSDVSIDLYMSRHSTAKDMGSSGAFEDVVRWGKYDVAFLESSQWRRADLDAVNSYTQKGIGLDVLMSRLPDSQGLRTLLAVGSEKLPVAFADIPHRDEMAAGELFAELRQEVNLTAGDELGFAAYQNLREWYAVGTIGSTLQSMHEEAPLRGLLSYGIGHQDICRKLALFGVDAKMVNPDFRMSDQGRRVMAMIATGGNSWDK